MNYFTADICNFILVVKNPHDPAREYFAQSTPGM